MLGRRDFLAGAAVLPAADIDVTGASPSLVLAMQATPDGRTVTQDDFRGRVTMLYFGYTFCPDVCPLVMQNVADALGKAGKDVADQVRFLFVTVDPERDTVASLSSYTAAFGPQFVGLRGDPNALERLARRFRVAYAVSPSDDPARYEVTHSAAIYVFDRGLNARFLLASMDTGDADIDGLARDLARLAGETPSRWGWLRGIV